MNTGIMYRMEFDLNSQQLLGSLFRTFSNDIWVLASFFICVKINSKSTASFDLMASTNNCYGFLRSLTENRFSFT